MSAEDETINVDEANQDSEDSGEWTCSACGNKNYSHRTVCNMRKCQTSRDGSKPAKGGKRLTDRDDEGGDEESRDGKRTKNGDNWLCKGCGNENYASRTFCNMRKCRAPREEWICAACGNLNFKHRTTCNMRKCGAPRPGSTMPMGLFGAPPGPIGGGHASHHHDQLRQAQAAAQMYGAYGLGMPPGPSEADLYGSSSLLAQQSYPQLQALMGGGQNPYLGFTSAQPSQGHGGHGGHGGQGGYGGHGGRGMDPTGRKTGERSQQRTGGESKEGDWTCPKCGNVNYVSRTRCNMRSCKEQKPE